MPTVRQATMALLRQHDLTTWFGNPGSSELTLLEDFPSDFRYALGLQEWASASSAPCRCTRLNYGACSVRYAPPET
jgi:benzoylformate decarboxylase